MDEGKLIYLIIAIVVLVFRALGKKDAKKAPNTPTQPAPKQPEKGGDNMSLEDMIRALRGETKPQEQLKPDPAANIDREPKSYKKEIPAKYKNIEAEAMLKKDHKALKPKDYDDGITFHFAGEEDDTESFDFDARQAVIYSEIMKRPEY